MDKPSTSYSTSQQQEREDDDSTEDLMNPLFKSLNPCSNSFGHICQFMHPLTEDGLIKKAVITKGKGVTLTGDHEIYLHYAGYIENQMEPFDASTVRSMTPRRYHIKDRALLPGFRICLSSMQEHEVSQFYVNYTLAYGKLGSPPLIPPCSDIMFVISTFEALECGHLMKLASIEHNTPLKMLFKIFNSYICLGLHYYRHNKYRKAYKKFKDASVILNRALCDSDEDHKIYMIYKKKLFISLVACLCQNNHFRPKKLLKLAREAELFTSNGVKDYMIYNMCIAIAHFYFNNFDSAIEYAKRAQILEPLNMEISKLLVQIQKGIDKYHLEEKQIWRRAFSAMGITPVPKKDPCKAQSGLEPSRKRMQDLMSSFMDAEDTVEINLGSGYTPVERLIIKDEAEYIGIQYKEVPDAVGRNNLILRKP